MVYTNSGPQSTCVPLLVELLLFGETGSAQAEVDRLFGELLVIGVRDKGGYRVPPNERADIWWEGWPNDVPPGWAWGQKCPADETYPNCVNGLPYLRDKDSLPTDSVRAHRNAQLDPRYDRAYPGINTSKPRWWPAASGISSFGNLSREQSALLGRVERQIEFGQARRCQLDRLTPLQDRLD